MVFKVHIKAQQFNFLFSFYIRSSHLNWKELDVVFEFVSEIGSELDQCHCKWLLARLQP